jgi:hypothetical protein
MRRRFLPTTTVIAGTIILTTAVIAPSAAASPRSIEGPDSTCSTSYLPLPDPSCTPGVTNPDVTQATIDSTICVSGWTSTIRPPTSYTNKLKAQGVIDYGYSDTNMSDYEEDHFLALEDGGDPRSPQNLWPEPHSGDANSYNKDGVETKVKDAICNGTATLADAQRAMLTNWTTAEQVLGIG